MQRKQKKEIIKIRPEIYEIDNRTVKKTSKTEKWFSDKINKVDKAL